MGSETVASHNKKEIRESSLGDIEDAYLELIKAYSAFLAFVIIEKRYLLHFMVPLIIMRRGGILVLNWINQMMLKRIMLL